MEFMCLNHLLEGEITDDVTVQHKEGLVVLAEDVLGEGEGSGGAQGLLLVGEGDADAETRGFNLT
jgi:hypothetical protein